MTPNQDLFFFTGLAPRGMRRMVDYLMLTFSLLLGGVLVRAIQMADTQPLATRYAVYLALATILVLAYFLTRAVAIRIDLQRKDLILEGYSRLSRKRTLPLSSIQTVVRVEGSHHLVRLVLVESGEWTISLDDPEGFIMSLETLL